MIFALRWQTLVRAVGLIVFLIVFLVALVVGDVSKLWELRGVVLLALLIFFGALTIPRVFRFAHKYTLAKYWMFPLLDGEWSAQLYSNWPLILKTYESAKGGGPPFDARVDMLSTSEESNRDVEAVVTIKSSMFLISMTLQPVGSGGSSRTRFVRPLLGSDNRPEISYVYEQEDLGRIALTDVRNHHGAGIMRYDADTDELAGVYWNDRNHDAGLNSAGTIRMTRIPQSATENKP